MNLTPLEEHTALVAAVIEVLRLAEAAARRWDKVRIHVAPMDADDGGRSMVVLDFITAQHPARAIAVHREALERLNRHEPDEHDACWHGDWAEIWRNCPEIAGLRSVYMTKGEQSGPRTQHGN